ncbi:MAG: helix-turn-helix transcriptional regulator [Acidovorax sp.]|nr:helix-turn-helix transcriptional regulator [Acidovorax sp.]
MIRSPSDLDNLTPAELGHRIRKAREARNLTLSELMRRTGVHHSQLSRIERGQFRLNGKNVRKICKALGIGPGSVDIDFLCARVRLTIRTTKAERAMNAFLDAVDGVQS